MNVEGRILAEHRGYCVEPLEQDPRAAKPTADTTTCFLCPQLRGGPTQSLSLAQIETVLSAAEFIAKRKGCVWSVGVW